MADKTLKLANFKYGLDSRRADLASQPGTLQTCENGYINPGGEVDKRYTFYNAGVDFPENTFGLQDVEDGMEAYGSDETPSGALPDNVSYVRLQHPTVLDGHAYDETLHDMVQVIDSCNADGKAFVIAKFSDGRSFLYYDGVLVDSSRNGLVMTGASSLWYLAIDLARQINAIGGNWTAVSNEDENGNTLIGGVVIKSPIGTYFTPVPDYSGSENGVIGQRMVDQDYAGTAGQRAVSKFEITYTGTVSTTYSLSAPRDQDGSGTVDLCETVVVGAGDSIQEVAERIASGINAMTFLHGYTADTAQVSGLVYAVFVYAPLAWGADANAFGVTVTIVGDGAVGATVINSSLTASVDPAFVNYTLVSNTALLDVYSDYVTASAIGGTPSYSYAWTEISQSDTDHPIKILDADKATTRFVTRSMGFTGRSAVFRVTVTDSLMATSAVDVRVTLSHESKL